MNIAPAFRSGSFRLKICYQCLRWQQTRLPPLRSQRLPPHQLYRPNRLFSTTRAPAATAAATQSSGNNPLRSSSAKASHAKDDPSVQYKRGMARSAAGIAVCGLAMYAIIQLNLFGLPEDDKQNVRKDEKSNSGSIQLDGPSKFPSSPSVIRIHGQDGVEQVETGNSTVPLFPTTIKLPKVVDSSSLQPGQELSVAPESTEEYQLLGLGIRTVSFLSIQVYVVGLYVAKSDIAALQQQLVQIGVQPPSADGPLSGGAVTATSLVSTEREALRKLLLDPERGEDAWDKTLRDGNTRTAIRIVPTRNTDFMHLRDAWVRGMTARAQKAAVKAKDLARDDPSRPSVSEFDDSFGESVNEFKTLLGGGSRKNIPKGQVLLLLRSQQGDLDALFQPNPAQPMRWLGRVPDERVSRLVWLNYLAGKTVASEAARASIVDGVMGIVERPVGTVVQKIV